MFPGCLAHVYPLHLRWGYIKESLIKPFEAQPAGTPTPDGRELDGPWSRVRFDIVLAPASA